MVKTFEHYFNGIIHAIQTLFKGKLIYYFIPSIVLGLILGYYFFGMSGARSSVDVLDAIPIIGGVLSWVFSFFLDGLDAIVMFIFQFIVLVCFSPFNALLAEKYDNELTGNKFDGGFLRIVNDVLRALFIVFICIIMNLFFMLLWFTFSLMFPVLDKITEPVYFIVNSFFLGFSLFDYALERYSIGTFGTIGYGFKRFLTVTIAGSLFSLLLMIPYIGIIFGPGLLTMVTTYVYIHKENKLNPIKIVDETDEEESNAF